MGRRRDRASTGHAISPDLIQATKDLATKGEEWSKADKALKGALEADGFAGPSRTGETEAVAKAQEAESHARSEYSKAKRTWDQLTQAETRARDARTREDARRSARQAVQDRAELAADSAAKYRLPPIRRASVADDLLSGWEEVINYGLPSSSRPHGPALPRIPEEIELSDLAPNPHTRR
ncbi:hypothetical protein [Saccharopolyspora gregorii]|uniref:Uncharacterized protein n=1 Tax=Saccharopolyspora gregorii TaxID=33914 RepID=A0ABP6S333_9PSEU